MKNFVKPFLTENVENFLRSANIKGIPKYEFPKSNCNPKVSNTFDLKKVFGLKSGFGFYDPVSNPLLNVLDKRIGIFTSYSGDKKGDITSFKCHLFCSQIPLLELLDYDPSLILSKIQYYRFEFDPSVAGNNFREPFFHFHTKPDGAPRIKFTSKDNFLTEIMYFTYVNHMPLHWQKWLSETIWDNKKHFEKKHHTDIDELLNEVSGIDVDLPINPPKGKKPKKPIDNFIKSRHGDIKFLSSLIKLIELEKKNVTTHHLTPSPDFNPFFEI